MSRLLTSYLPFSPAISPLQATTYLLFICLSSISFLVFLNASISFVLTDLLSLHKGIGAKVGTLGFADELVALVACPIWGIVSDRVGVRWVACWGYTIVAVALVGVVSVGNGEQEQQQEGLWEGWGSGVGLRLVLARMGFSVGGAAVATMVTAGLPTMVGGGKTITGRGGKRGTIEAENGSGTERVVRSSIADSLESQLTVTPERYNIRAQGRSRENETENESMIKSSEKAASSPPKLAGLVGVFTGLGAILGLLVFLPLPAQFSKLKGVTQGQAVQYAFYVVGVVALCVAIACFFGLRNLPGEEGKGWRMLLGTSKNSSGYQTVPNDASRHTDGGGGPKPITPFLPYWRLLFDSTVLGFKDAQIGLGYLGGFVARASSVGISLFIPLYINAYFIRNGFCQGSPTDPSPELKKECRAAYLLSSELTGISQLIALLCAPAFGYLSDRYRRFNLPMLVAAVLGIIGYTSFARLASPEVKNIEGRGGSPSVFLIVALIGISQIGAIVCSLGLLGRGVLGAEGGYNLSSQLKHGTATSTVLNDTPESAPLLNDSHEEHDEESRTHLKGSIAGVYSLSGGAAILLLTKLGGYLFDTLSPGAPFYMMAVFNGVLLIVGIGSGAYREFKTRQTSS